MTNHREIRRIIYTLSRKWGKPGTVYRSVETLNTKTGVKSSVVSDTQSVSRLIILPRKMVTDFSYDLSFIASNKEFTYGGFYGKTQSLVLIDSNLMGSYVIQEKDNLTIQGSKYVIDDLDFYDSGGTVIAYMLKVTKLEAQP